MMLRMPDAVYGDDDDSCWPWKDNTNVGCDEMTAFQKILFACMRLMVT